MRVNPDLLRQITWEQVQALNSDWQQWTLPDQDDQSTNPLIIQFVQKFLPTNYQATLTPYDTARTLHRAVAKSLVYKTPALHGDAVGSLTDGFSDCTGFAALLTASLRAVGIPARRISGFWPGVNQSHWRVEFHLPLTNIDWIIADPNEGYICDSTGTYAYGFGYLPDANTFFAVDTGDNHILPYASIDSLPVAVVDWNVSSAPSYQFATPATFTIVSNDIPPSLSDPIVSPQFGCSTTSFAFQTTYADPDGDPPAYVQAQILSPGSNVLATYSMKVAPSQTGDYTSGVNFIFNLEAPFPLGPGAYLVDFATTDGVSPPVTSGFSSLFVEALSRPVIQTVQYTSHSLVFAWTAETNQLYQIQSKADLNLLNWINSGDPFTATNSVMTMSVPIASNSQQFYRVVVLQ
jgi:hypothetical protein